MADFDFDYDLYLWYTGGRGQVVGSYVDISYGSVAKYIQLVLSRNPNSIGRYLTLAYWVCDKNFDITNLEMDSSKDNGPRYCTSINSDYPIDKFNIKYSGDNFYTHFVNTDLIPDNKNSICTFNFNVNDDDNDVNSLKLKKDKDGIKASKIFVALISIKPNAPECDYDKTTFRVLSTSGTAYIKDNWNTNIVRINNNHGLYIKDSLFENPDGNSSNSEESSNVKPAKIACLDLRYRTWSDPDGNFEINNSSFNNKYTIAFADGGNNYSDVSEFKNLNYTYNNESDNLKTHIVNINNSFESDFNIPEGRLKDVIFANPERESYDFESSTATSASEGRWVFKRSRIKFTIPPAMKNGKPVNKGIVLRYKVVTSLFDSKVYSTQYKIKEYDVNEATKNIELVICPRDEGVLDNMEFTVLLSRKYKGTSNSQYSTEAAYKFRTYQKPTVNIASPKIIRNSATGTDFKYAKILTSNMYSNFNGENTIVNKYVCDALTVILATPQNDASDIPMFVRFFLAEFKYGRDGRINPNYENANNLAETYDANFDTIQALYKSQNPSKYTTKTEILENTFDEHKRTAYLTGIYSNDGQPILLSGRFTNKTLTDVGKNFKLWTYKDWDYVVENKDKDELVGNAWQIEGVLRDTEGNIKYDSDGKPLTGRITDLVVGDHVGAPVTKLASDGFLKYAPQTVSKNILFRAGYIYLLRVRMFHGAAAGAIAEKVNNAPARFKKKYNVIYGMENGGNYEYSGSTYSDKKTYPRVDSATHGELKPFNGWLGPNDGTVNEPIFKSNTHNSRLEQTYCGFSEVDYTLIEPVCPYTSKSNLITVHPTSPQIGVNQWLTFNYRHLAKNVAGIDTNSAYFENDKYNTKSNVFGKVAGGIQNTLTRMISMYVSSVETIIDNYMSKDFRTADGFNNLFGKPHTCKDSVPVINHEKISLWIKPISARSLSDSNDTLQNFVSAYDRKPDNTYPLIFEYDINGKTKEQVLTTNALYFASSLCSKFTEYKSNLSLENKEKYTLDLSTFASNSAPEWDIIYKRYNTLQIGSAERYLKLNEPMGNTYRWQPVINAITINDSNVSEIKIEDNPDNVTLAKTYTIGANTLNQTDKPVQLIYAKDVNDKNYDLQTKYFYTDVHSILASDVSLSNTEDKRFCIKEFCGSVVGLIHDSGFAVMYTSASYPITTVYNDNKVKSIKYFCTSKDKNEDYGHLYARVSSLQDCECGIPTPTDLPNVGNLSSIGAVSINTNEHNAIPITRTTHYLYFKTWINTTFCMKVDVSLTVNHTCNTRKVTKDDGEDEECIGHTSESIDKTYWFNGDTLNIDQNVVYNSNDNRLLSTYPSHEIKFGNNNGLSEVYGEDNKGWGRCLSADDISNRQIKFDGTINPKKTDSGGLEVPVMVRYTPLLQPRLLAKTCKNSNNNNDDTYLSLSSSNITLYKCKGKKQWLSSFVDSTLSNNGDYSQIQTGEINLKVAYPHIKENNTYYTVSPNGGNNGNVYFDDYYIDVDTDASKSIDTLSPDASTNMDFLGGNGICTAYTVILVPSNPKLPNNSEFFNNTDGHWNFFKQSANYYKSADIFKEVRSKTVKNCGPVLVGYNLQPTKHPETCNYLNNTQDNSIPNDFIDAAHRDDSFMGKNFQTISLNFTNLRQGKVAMFDNDTFVTQSDANDLLGLTEDKRLDKANILQVGVIYDLLIIPVYSNRYNHSGLIYPNYNCYDDKKPGSINKNVPGGEIVEKFTGNIHDANNTNSGEVHLAGSNPLVLYNYFQIGSEIEITCPTDGGGGGGGGGINHDKDEPNPLYVNDSDSAIIFPNVDNEMFNVTSGLIKESPGFWLNNSFRLILRMPSFRLKGKEYNDSDLNTIDNASNGHLLTDDGKTANDFEFSDIQIHIGKIEELTKYGYPDDQHLNLNKISDIRELAKAHIISYKDYGHMGMGVFSKKLSKYNVDSDNVDEDTRELLTGGSLDPMDEYYANRFIEVNLSNCKIMNENGDMVPIYTKYPEGFYIQFRWKSKYAESQPEEHRWSDWYGGTYDGGLKWWGTNGLDYFVPVRNYSTIYTDFRNYIKESYPGSYTTMPKEPIELSEDNIRIIENITGKGSIMKKGSVTENSQNKPQDGIEPAFYNVGVGNHSDALIVPSNKELTNVKNITVSDSKSIDLSKNNDSVYLDEIQYIFSHDKQDKQDKQNDIFSVLDKKSFDNHQNLWEMLYVDYIIRNMCKLYYKPKYNKRDDNYKFKPNNNKYNDNLYYHLSTPKEITLNKLTWGWDNTEYRMFNDWELIDKFKGSDKEEKEFTEDKSYQNNKLYSYDVQNATNSNRIEGPNAFSHNRIKHIDNRNKWNRNKYYRRIITRQDFDELNKHLEDLVEFIRHPYFTGLTDNNFDMVGESVPTSKKELQHSFPKARGGIIGHDIHGDAGLRGIQFNVNNINHSMVDSNYIQNLWQNILSVCRPSIQANTKVNINL